MAPPPIPDKIPCTTPSEFAHELKDINNVFAQPETEHTWENIARAMTKLAALTRGGAHKLDPDYVNAIKNQYKPISTSMLSERTRLSAAALDVISAMAPRLGTRFEPLVNHLFPSVLKVCVRPNKVFSTRGLACLLLILEHCHLPTMVPYLREAVKDKSQTLRLAGIEGTLKVMENWERKDLDVREGAPPIGTRYRGNVEDIEVIIKETVRDANPQIRQLSRKVFEVYMEMFSERVEAFTIPLSPTTRRYLDMKPGGAAKPKTKALVTDGVGQQTGQPSGVSSHPSSRPPSRATHQAPQRPATAHHDASAIGSSDGRNTPIAQTESRSQPSSYQINDRIPSGPIRVERRAPLPSAPMPSGSLSSMPPSRPQLRPQTSNPPSSNPNPLPSNYMAPIRPHNVGPTRPMNTAKPVSSNNLNGNGTSAVASGPGPSRPVRAKTDMGPPVAPVRPNPAATGPIRGAAPPKEAPFRPNRNMRNDVHLETTTTPEVEIPVVPLAKDSLHTQPTPVDDPRGRSTPVVIEELRPGTPSTPVSSTPVDPSSRNASPADIPPICAQTPTIQNSPVLSCSTSSAVSTSTTTTACSSTSGSHPNTRPPPAILIKKLAAQHGGAINNGGFVPTRKRTALTEPTLSQMAKMKPAVPVAPKKESTGSSSSATTAASQKKNVITKKAAAAAPPPPPPVKKAPTPSKTVELKNKKGGTTITRGKPTLKAPPVAPEMKVAMEIPLPPVTPEEIPLPPATPDEVPLPDEKNDELYDDLMSVLTAEETPVVPQVVASTAPTQPAASELTNYSAPLVDFLITPARPHLTDIMPHASAYQATVRKPRDSIFPDLIDLDQSLVWTGNQDHMKTPLIPFNPQTFDYSSLQHHRALPTTMVPQHPFSVYADNEDDSMTETPKAITRINKTVVPTNPVAALVTPVAKNKIQGVPVMMPFKDFMDDDTVVLKEVADLERVALGEKEMNVLVRL